MKKQRRKALKFHYCIECSEEIAPKDYYLEISGDDGYNHWTIRKCKYCMKWEIRPNDNQL